MAIRKRRRRKWVVRWKNPGHYSKTEQGREEEGESGVRTVTETIILHRYIYRFGILCC